MLIAKFFGKVDIFKVTEFSELLFRLGMNLIVVFIIIRILYYSGSKRKEYLFSYFLINFVIFSMTAVLSDVQLDMGFALGLFAVFGIIRYRTIPLPIKEMTYLFVIIGVAVINALWNAPVTFTQIIFINVFLIAVCVALEKVWFSQHESSKMIVYENIHLIVPEKHPEMLEDLKTRTGLEVTGFNIEDVDFLKDVAKVKIFYRNLDDKSDMYSIND